MVDCELKLGCCAIFGGSRDQANLYCNSTHSCFLMGIGRNKKYFFTFLDTSDKVSYIHFRPYT